MSVSPSSGFPIMLTVSENSRVAFHFSSLFSLVPLFEDNGVLIRPSHSGTLAPFLGPSLP